MEVEAVGPVGEVGFRDLQPGHGCLGKNRRGEILGSRPSVAAGYLQPDVSIDAFDPEALPTGDDAECLLGQLRSVRQAAITPRVAQWGMHPSLTRAAAGLASVLAGLKINRITG